MRNRDKIKPAAIALVEATEALLALYGSSEHNGESWGTPGAPERRIQDVQDAIDDARRALGLPSSPVGFVSSIDSRQTQRRSIDEVLGTPDAIAKIVVALPESQPDKLVWPVRRIQKELEKANEWTRNCTSDLNSEMGRVRAKIRELWTDAEIREAAEQSGVGGVA